MFFGKQSLKAKQVEEEEIEENVNYLVTSQIGYATIHWGKHPHLVTVLEKGIRTNVIMTLCFKDKSKSKATKSDCFQDDALK